MINDPYARGKVKRFILPAIVLGVIILFILTKEIYFFMNGTFLSGIITLLFVVILLRSAYVVVSKLLKKEIEYNKIRMTFPNTMGIIRLNINPWGVSIHILFWEILFKNRTNDELM